AARGQLVTKCKRIARILTRNLERLLRFANRLFPILQRNERTVAALGRAPSALGQLRQVELALLDRDLDLVHLVARAGYARARVHQRLARLGERLFLLPPP